MRKYTNWKHLLLTSSENKRIKILNNPIKYLLFKPDNYTKDYLKNLKYRLNKHYGRTKQRTETGPPMGNPEQRKKGSTGILDFHQ